MTLVLAGSLPVSGVNLGLSSASAGLAAEITKLQADYIGAFPALAGQLQISANVPNLAGVTAGVGAALNAPRLAAGMVGITAGSSSLAADVALKLGLVTGQIAAGEGIESAIGGGLDAGGISGWSYAGRISRFARKLDGETRSGGFGAVGPDDTVTAVVIATESFASWQSFSQGAETGTTADQQATANDEALTFLGSRGGAEWNTGTADLVARLDLLLAELRGQKSALETQLELFLGIGLPSPTVVVDSGLGVVANVGFDGLLDNLISVQADITGMLGTLQARIDAVVSLQADIDAQLSAGGLSVWIYTGRARDLARELDAEIADGLPGGSGRTAPVYGLVLVGRPPAMTTFGTTFLTAS